MEHLAARLLTMLFTVALGCALCLVLYYKDNKYTSPGPQGIDGLLVLREADLTEDQIHYLIHGWAFYPDVLFTPAQLQEEGDDRYMTYCAIGEKTNFKTAASDDPHGCGSYVLTLLLPETERVYALELPEIYSAYRLYVNDTLVAQMGDPDEETYTPRTKIETVTFQASGRVTLLLAVRDASHYYSGLVYPPAFGLPGGVTLLRGLSLSLQVSALVLSLVCAAMAFFAGYRLQRQDAKLFGILCLFAALTTILQLLHRFIPLPIHPWYAMESFCGHCIILFVVLLQNRICDVERRVAAFFTAAGTLFCFASLLYGLLSSHLTIPVMAVFSGIITLFKLGTALYLLAVAFYALLKKQLKMAPLFYASTLYTTLLIWDRLLPQFEPRLAGWFSEWGTLAMIVAIGLSLWRDILAAYARSLAFAEEHRQIERQYAMQMQYANRTAQYIAENRRLLHDVRQHVRTIAELASQVKSQPETAHAQEALMHYLEALPHTLKPGNAIAPGTFSNHAAVDALLQFYQAAAEKYHIRAQLTFNIPQGLPLTDLEWCALLGNLMENAIEGCQRCPEGARRLSIQVRAAESTFFLKVENSYDGRYQRTGTRFLSRKRGSEQLGIGLESVRQTVEAHHGTLDIYPLQKTFRVGITLPLHHDVPAAPVEA